MNKLHVECNNTPVKMRILAFIQANPCRIINTTAVIIRVYENFTLPHIFHVEFRHFSFGGSPANFLSRVHQESTWSPVVPSGQHGLHLRTQATELTNQTPCFTYHCHTDTMQGQCFFFQFPDSLCFLVSWITVCIFSKKSMINIIQSTKSILRKDVGEMVNRTHSVHTTFMLLFKQDKGLQSSTTLQQNKVH